MAAYLPNVPETIVAFLSTASINVGYEKLSGTDYEKYMLDKGEIERNKSGRQEMLENLINDYL